MSQRVQDLYEENEFEELLEDARMNAANDWEAVETPGNISEQRNENHENQHEQLYRRPQRRDRCFEACLLDCRKKRGG